MTLTNDPGDAEHAPITLELHVPATPEAAFDVYARRIGEWWPAAYSRDAATFTGVTIEPFVDGRVFATFADGADDDWGRVRAYEPGRRLVHSFTLAQPPEQPPSEIDVRFAPAAGGAGCTVHFAHGGWNASNVLSRAKFREWPIILDRFVERATRAHA